MVRNIQKEISRIRELLNDDTSKSHLEICKLLNMPVSTFQRRMTQIKQENREAQQPTIIKAKENKVERIKEALEAVSKINYITMTDTRTPPRDRIKASDSYLKSELFIFGNVDFIMANLPKVEKFLSHNAMDIGDAFDK
jgi:sugar-specific transcriptional regulator TrmB